MTKRRRLLTVCLCLLWIPGSVSSMLAEESPEATTDLEEILERLEDRVSGIQTLRTDFVQQKYLARQRLRHIALALLAVWVVWTFLLGDSNLFRLWSVKRENAALNVEIQELEGREQALERDVDALSTGKDPQLIEDLAREEHAMVRDGETLVRFVPAGSK